MMRQVAFLGIFVLWICCSQILFTTAVTNKDIDKYLKRCISSKTHKEKPEKITTAFHCSPWKDNACCTANTTLSIASDNPLSPYNKRWNQCNQMMSNKCRRFFQMDSCFYHCSPNLAPWIARKGMFIAAPLCSSDCEDWFEACKEDLTCSNNWEDSSTWNSTAGVCNMPCKKFKDYFSGAENFCNMIFNHSFVYTKGTPGQDCLVLWPNGTRSGSNTKLARMVAEKRILVNSSGSTTPSRPTTTSEGPATTWNPLVTASALLGTILALFPTM